jgi:uncharacterized protein YqeY
MSIKEKLLEDLKQAMKDKADLKKDTIQLVRSGVLQVEKDTKVTLQDDGVIEIIAKEVKKRVDTLPEFEKSGRTDLIEKLNKELEILRAYLPEQLSESELEEIVKIAIQETGAASAKDTGKVMQAVVPKTKGRADGKTINLIVKRLLG